MRKAGDHRHPLAPTSYLLVILPAFPYLPSGFGRKQRKDYMLFAVNRSHRKFCGLSTSRTRSERRNSRETRQLALLRRYLHALQFTAKLVVGG